ncbi:ABC transporter permease [uncultured Clostridium sp.]|uniref:ABC transporter permease n=1 Tax=uncultured Clostridium sp. TaxID=59620 RepID=UPI0025F106C2|nr:FtsX-like permease family protein [uncultured Clostridium sp.]MDU4883073.1 FtsX-like permease family protein [Clostridium celatum]MDU7076207.1 FtsX-like permease family protein [Clostridium celatum]
MYSKIAINNVKKSFKDYTIYFLTIAFAVCIFYSFNAIDAQKAVLDMNKSQAEYMTVVTTLISYVSVFVSFILGGLILYANNFLIKKRKKELGIYMTLGMKKSKISKILLGETLIVGILSLAAGLLLGVLLSQGLSLFTAKLFEVDMTEFKFIISFGAISKTILYFAIIFGILMIFNTTIVSRYKLIDMLNAGRKNEEIKIKNPIVSSIIFIISALILIVAYYLVSKVGLNMQKIEFKASIVLGILGTVGFFFGISGFLIAIVQKSKNIYFKKLNIFITRQISSKVNTNFISMAVISLMLFITIVLLSTGLSFKNALEAGIVAPFDASVKLYTEEGDKYTSIEQLLNIAKYDFKDNKAIFFNTYRMDGPDPNSILKDYAVGEFKKDLDNGKQRWESIDLIKLSDFNKLRELEGKSTFTMNDDEVMLLSNFNTAKSSIENMIKLKGIVNLNGKEYKVANTEYLDDALYNSSVADNVLTLIVNDNFDGDIYLSNAYMNVNYKNPGDESAEEDIKNSFYNTKDNKELYDLPLITYTKQDVYDQNKTMGVTILYIGLYLGIVFLIASAAVLALQQLSEASDSSDRYKALKKIGATEKMINKTIFAQTVIYFVMPLGLAIVSSIVGINVVNKFLSMYGNTNIVPTSLLTLAILVIVYGGYFYVTYTGYKSIVKNSK